MLVCCPYIHFGECLSKYFAHILIEQFIFFLLVLRVFHVSNTNSLLAMLFANIFSQLVACLLILVTGSFTEHYILIVVEVSLINFTNVNRVER